MTVFSGECLGASGTDTTGSWSFDDSTGVLTISGTVIGAFKVVRSGSSIVRCYGISNLSSESAYSGFDVTKVTKIVVNSGVTTITKHSSLGNTSGLFANATSLKEVVLPNTLTTIGQRIFYQDMALTSITIPESVITIENYAFWGCGLTEVIIPNSVTSIGTSFAGCSNLKSVTFGTGITNITTCPVNDCLALEELIFLSKQAPTMAKYSFGIGNSSGSVTVTVYTNGGWGSDDVFTLDIRKTNSSNCYTTFVYKKLVTVNVNVNVSGTWKPSVPYVNVNGTWKEVVGVYVNVNGTWKEAV